MCECVRHTVSCHHVCLTLDAVCAGARPRRLGCRQAYLLLEPLAVPLWRERVLRSLPCRHLGCSLQHCMDEELRVRRRLPSAPDAGTHTSEAYTAAHTNNFSDTHTNQAALPWVLVRLGRVTLP